MFYFHQTENAVEENHDFQSLLGHDRGSFCIGLGQPVFSNAVSSTTARDTIKLYFLTFAFLHFNLRLPSYMKDVLKFDTKSVRIFF